MAATSGPLGFRWSSSSRISRIPASGAILRAVVATGARADIDGLVIEDMRAGRTKRHGAMHATSGYSVPTTYGTSYRYQRTQLRSDG